MQHNKEKEHFCSFLIRLGGKELLASRHKALLAHVALVQHVDPLRDVWAAVAADVGVGAVSDGDLRKREREREKKKKK